MSAPLPLEGDGLIDNLFHFLWSKDDFNAGPHIFVPHTVVYKSTQPVAWYFTSLRSGKIKKKNKVNLTNLQIEHEFTKHTKLLSSHSSSDIIACYLYQAPSTAPHPILDHDSGSTLIEYFDATALHDFLFAREKMRDGILQRFVLPKGTHNATIRAIWSPKICLLERRVNTKSLYDPRYSVYERGVTFDGGGAGELFSRPEPVRGAVLPGEVQLLCEQVVDHVTQVSYHKFRISRMVLHLKSDADGRLWLLWCSSLRLVRQSALDGAPRMRPLDIVSDAQVPPHISLGQVSHPSPVVGPTPQHQLRGNASDQQLKHNRNHHLDEQETPVRDGFQRCTSCARVVEQRLMLTTNFKAVLAHFNKFLLFLRLRLNEKEQIAIEWPPDQRLVDAAGGVGFGILPFCEKPSVALAPACFVPHSLRRAHFAGLNATELIIPPIIQYLHPTLAVEDFDRHRTDPIFLHKPVAVCEDCCLVYSDYATTSLEVNSLRPNVPAILRPQREVSDLKQRLDPIDPISVTVVSPTHNQSRLVPASKPPQSAWKPILKSARRRSAASDLTKPTLHTALPAPRLPDHIESLAEFIGSAGSDNDGGAQLQEREETFFRELYHQQGVREGHPLHHMLESAKQLSRVAEANKQIDAIREGAKATGSGRRTNGQADWSALGKSMSMSALDNVLTKKLAKNPYSIVQRISELDSRKSRKQKPSRMATDAKRHSIGSSGDQSNFPSMRDGDIENQHEESPLKSKSSNNKSPQRNFISSRETLAAEAHQEFLFAALHNAQAQLDQLDSLSPIVLSACPTSVRAMDAHEAMPQEAATIDELQSLLSDIASLHYEIDDADGSDEEMS